MINLEVNESYFVEIGGIKQYLQVRGTNKNNPLLLFLHGGPGSALSSISDVFPDKIVENFSVVHWDQRGAGKSYSDGILPESMTVEQFISDTIEVTDHLLDKYEKEKIFLLGLSWGSVLGINAAQLHPEKYYCYIGISQVVDMEKGEEISYDFILEESKKIGNAEAIKDLELIGRPPYKNTDDITIQRKWLNELGYAERLVSSSQFYMENCNQEELMQIVKGVQFSEETIFENLMDLNMNHIKELRLPVYLCMGKYDYQTPFELTLNFYNNLKADKKEFLWFEESAHGTVLEEPKRFVEILLKVKEECNE